ncbi:MAG: RES family NAD+ phosphorylase [Clostridia bacterium]|nr:RES family NAD+ phosphorylase [Clostridia bacterium]
MNCCEYCFKDIEIKAIIRGQNQKGQCDFCNRKNVYIVDVATNTEIKDNFERFIDIYSSETDKPDEFPREKMDLLKNILSNNWNVFNLKSDCIYKFLTNLLSEKYNSQPELFDRPVGIFEIIDDDYLQQYSILGNYQWEDFVEEIKQKNRFHTNIINKDILSKLLQFSFKKYKKGCSFYRARICKTEDGFRKNEMGAPPSSKASSGRANPEGISCLYLSNTIDTTLYETRAGVYDYVTVGKFVLQKDIEVVNLSDIDKLSPFIVPDINLIAANITHLNNISADIAKPLRRNESSLDYLPTQYICDYIKSQNFAGVEYKSTIYNSGINYAIFDESFFKCTQTKVYDVKSIKYDYDFLKN